MLVSIFWAESAVGGDYAARNNRIMKAEEEHTGNELMYWLKAFGLYLVHVLIGTIGVFLVTVFLGAGAEHLLNAEAGGAFDAFWGGSVFLPFIILGFLAGFFINRRLQSKSAKWAWIIPTFPIVYDFYSFTNLGWESTFIYLFAPKHGGGIEQFVTVAPFYGSIAYSLGAWLALKRRSDHVAEQTEKQSGTTRVLLLLALYSMVVVTAVLVLAFVLVLGTMLVSHSAGRLAMVSFSGPYYVGEIVVALVGGALAGSRIRPDLAKWVWVLPSILLFILFAIYSAHSTAQMRTTEGLWSQFFTSACANPHIACPQETLGTCPFLSSVAYSIGAWMVSRFKASQITVQSS